MANIIKRDFYNHVHYELDRINKVVHLLPNFFNQLQNKKIKGRFGYKKIGGSSIGDVLEVDQFKSQFAAFCRMTWIGLPILDRKYVDAGIAIEPLVIAAVEKMTNQQVTTYDPFQYNFDFFKDKDPIVGGLPDGYIPALDLILEIKTTNEKNLSKWNTYGVPGAYLKQAQLYAYLMGASKYTIVATFLKDEDYLDPQNYPIRKRKIKNWNYSVNNAQVQDDIKKVKTWYQKYSNNPTSPVYQEDRDADLIAWLAVSNESEWEDLKMQWIAEGKLVI